MTNQVYRCANCGASLASHDTICLRCEPELSPPNIDPNVGKYRCPSCRCRFDLADAAFWPPNVKWYWPQTLKSRCPHCGVFLRDKKILNRKPAELGIIAFLIIASSFSPWRPGTQIVLLIVLGAIDFTRWRRAKSCVSNEEERYEAEK